MDFSADCDASRRVETMPLLSMMPCRRVCSCRSETLWPVLLPRLVPTSARRPVETSFCATVSCDCSFIIVSREASAIALVDVTVVFMSLSRRREQRAVHVVDGGEELAGGLVRPLQIQHQRHFFVEVDAGGTRERIG